MRILFLGAPGAGKGTQCKKLADKYQLLHLSSGDLLREAVRMETEAGKEAKSYMEKGALVPDRILIAMFRDKLTSNKGKGFLLDGFPRNLAQAESLDAMLTEIGCGLTAVINLAVDDGLLTDRITGRRSCPKCGEVYHVRSMPPKQEGKCDKCGSDLIQRSDDKEELVKERLKTYKQQTEPLIDFYTGKGLLRTVNGEGSQEEIFSNIVKSVEGGVPVPKS